MVAALLMTVALVDPQGVSAAAPQADSTPPAEWRVVLAAPVYQPDGAIAVETTMLSNASANYSYVYGRRSICDTATTMATAEPVEAGYGWRLVTNTISRTDTELVVSIDWKRMWDRGQKLKDGPSGTVQLTLHPGDRIPLDHIPNTRASDTCRAVGIGLEVRIARAPASSMPHIMPRGESSNGAVLPLGATPGGTGVLKADIWLLHTRPTGAQEVLYQTVPLQVEGGSFVFPTLKLTTTRGELGVEMSGTIQRFRVPTGGPNGSEYLFVQLTRLVTGAGVTAGGLRSTTGGTPIELVPSQVLSFEFPAAPAMMRGGTAMRTGAGVGGGGGIGGGAGSAGTGAVIRSGSGAGGARGGGGAGGRGGAVSAGTEQAATMQRTTDTLRATALLEGNVFALRVRVQ